MQAWINQHPLLFVCLILAGGFLFQWLLLNLIAAASGWKILAQRFSVQQPFSGPQWKWQSARMRFGMGYNNSLKVGANRAGLFIQPVWVILAGHPPLFIPWSEISFGHAAGWMSNYVRLCLGRSEQIPFTIRPSLADRLRAAAGPGWPASSAVSK
ncbi:MAG TPA: hypothetical protein VI685_11735 [Candidatus Angelobacter sp.]